MHFFFAVMILVCLLVVRWIKLMSCIPSSPPALLVGNPQSFHFPLKDCKISVNQGNRRPNEVKPQKGKYSGSKFYGRTRVLCDPDSELKWILTYQFYDWAIDTFAYKLFPLMFALRHGMRLFAPASWCNQGTAFNSLGWVRKFWREKLNSIKSLARNSISYLSALLCLCPSCVCSSSPPSIIIIYIVSILHRHHVSFSSVAFVLNF